MLLYLIQHRDRVVSKQELLDQLWPDQVVSEAALERCITVARKAIGDSGARQQYIKTLHRHGYRFVAAVVERISAPPGSDLQKASSPSPDHDDTASHTEPSPVEQEELPPAPDFPLPASLSDGQATLEAERKQVTVLSCQVANPTMLAEHLSPEAKHQVMHHFFTLALQVVQRYEGTMQIFLDDGFVALFGAPIAHEDHGRRAVLAAHSMQQALRTGQGELTTPLQVCIALHTGPVMAWHIGQDWRTSAAEMGETVHLAARIQQYAEPGTIVISETTQRLVRDTVQVQKIGTVHATGQTTPVAVYQLLAIRPHRSFRGELRSYHSADFINREQELATLEDLFARTERGQGQVIGIVGEAGIGKSRLLTEFRQRLPEKRIVYLEGHCVSYGNTMPYLPICDLIRQMFGIIETDRPEPIMTKVHSGLQEGGIAPEVAAPLLLHLLGVTTGTEQLTKLSPGAIQTRLFATLRQISLSLSQRCPLVIMIENLHWIDRASEACLASLVDSVAGAAILLLTTYRPGYRPPWLEKSYATQMALPPLGPVESRRIIHAILPSAQLPDPLTQLILHKAEGNPFFLEELTHTVAEQGILQTEVTVPDTIQGVIQARIDRLPIPTKRLLQTASILGRVISFPLLQALWEGSEDVAPLLRDLQQRELLYEQTRDEESVHVFKHALIQEVAYGSLPLSRRQALHTLAGQALEALYAERLELVYAHLAYHYARTEQATKAVEYLQRFAEKAARSYAHVEAVTALQKACAHAERLPMLDRDCTLVDLILRQAFSLSVLGRFQEILDLLLKQRDRLERLQDPTKAGPYYVRLGLTSIYLGEKERAIQNAQQALGEAQRCQDSVTMGQAYYVLGLQSYLSGQFRQGVEYCRQARALLEGSVEQHWLGLAYWIMGYSAALLGEFDEALTAESQAYAIGETTEDPRLQSFADGLMGWIYAIRGEWEAAIAACQRSLECAPDPISRGLALGFSGCTYLEKGEVTHAIPQLEQAVQSFQQLRFGQGQTRFMPFLSEAFFLSGEHDKADERARQTIQLSERIGYTHGVGWAKRMLGRIAQTRTAFTEAHAHLQEALQLFTNLQARFEVGRTYLDLAALAHVQGDRAQTIAHLRAAHTLFTTLRVPRYVERTEHLARAYRISLNP
jgi:class 3 adenylate cyclase/tetratricopeptide (TPR) repeat protein